MATRMASTRTEELLKKDEHFFHPFGVVGEKSRIVWEKGRGAKLWDTEGHEVIDLSSAYAQCGHLGFSRKEINDAVYEQMQQLSHMFMQPPHTCVPAAEYSAELAQVLPGDINHVFFTNSGTESTEAAVKTARFYWYHKGQAGKYKIISMNEAYHGASHFAASICGWPYVRTSFGVEFPGIIRVPSFHAYKSPFGKDHAKILAYLLEQTILAEGPESIACMMAEPIQGYAGVVWPQDEYWPLVTAILKKYDILLICDEVQTGFCRTGKFWGVDNWNFVPDIMTMGKGINSMYLPLGAVGVCDKVYKFISGKEFVAGGTACGDAAAMASGRAALKIYIGEKLDQRAAKLGEHMHERLVKEFAILPCVDDVLGKGLYQSFEIVLNKTTGREVPPDVQTRATGDLFWKLMERGVFARIDHDRRVYLTPPLIIGEDELDKALDILLGAVKEVKPV